MILYHGTPESRARQIIDSGEIKHICKRLWDTSYINQDNEVKSITTTDGFVYLTDKFSLAAFYGNGPAMTDNNSDSYYVFRIDIPENILLPDQDELYMNYDLKKFDGTYKESLSISRCVRVNKSLHKKEHKIEYIKLPLTTEMIDSSYYPVLYDCFFKYRSRREKKDNIFVLLPDPDDLAERLNEIVNWVSL